ncbi:MAG: hypothetical protein ABR567_08425 [Myxococcales bacterium]|nr:hypothetical protein [Myxococcales bacterium]
MTRKAVQEFFAAYAEAFSHGDTEAIGQLWSLPALITAAQRSMCFADAEAFAKNTAAVCAFYREQGVVEARKTVLDVKDVGDTVAVVITRDEVVDASGREIARWKHAYLVRETPAGLRAIAAIADEEVQAWKARGTPLGS